MIRKPLVWLTAFSACTLVAGAGLAPARADVSGFAGFAPVNKSGSVTTVGYSDDKTAQILTDGGKGETASGFSPAPQRIAAFTASFTYQASRPGGGDPNGDGGDGIAFVLQDDPRGVGALGDPTQGNTLGYGGAGAIMHSVALRLSIFGGASESLGTNGEAQPYGDTGSVDLRNGHPIRITLDYDGAVLTETLKDAVTGDAFTEDHAVDIPAVLGEPTALVGFSGASGNATALQTVRDFTFTERPAVPAGQRKRVQIVTKSYKTLTDYVDPLIGTSAGGNTYPGAVAPFGMVQFSPDTRSPSIGYDYGDRQIQGFSLTHMSGIGCNDYGDVFLTATTGPVKTELADYQSPFSHRHEAASPGYYRALLTKWNVSAELTATERAGLVRFTFPAGQPGNVLVPISHTLTKTFGARVQVVGSDEISGQVTSQSFCGNSSRYTVYFVMKFDRPFQSSGTWTGAAHSDGSRSRHAGRRSAGHRGICQLPGRGGPQCHGPYRNILRRRRRGTPEFERRSRRQELRRCPQADGEKVAERAPRPRRAGRLDGPAHGLLYGAVSLPADAQRLQ